MSNVKEQSVTQLANAIQSCVTDSFGRVCVRGELSRVSKPASGHYYMDIKEGDTAINMVMWKSTAERMDYVPAANNEVVIEGKVTTYPSRSSYQILVDSMRPVGAGELGALLEALKKKLQAEGCFHEKTQKTYSSPSS